MCEARATLPRPAAAGRACVACSARLGRVPYSGVCVGRTPEPRRPGSGAFPGRMPQAETKCPRAGKPRAPPRKRQDPPAGTPTPPGGQGGALTQEVQKTVRNCGGRMGPGRGLSPPRVLRCGTGSPLMRTQRVRGRGARCSRFTCSPVRSRASSGGLPGAPRVARAIGRAALVRTPYVGARISVERPSCRYPSCGVVGSRLRVAVHCVKGLHASTQLWYAETSQYGCFS